MKKTVIKRRKRVPAASREVPTDSVSFKLPHLMPRRSAVRLSWLTPGPLFFP